MDNIKILQPVFEVKSIEHHVTKTLNEKKDFQIFHFILFSS